MDVTNQCGCTFSTLKFVYSGWHIPKNLKKDTCFVILNKKYVFVASMCVQSITSFYISKVLFFLIYETQLIFSVTFVLCAVLSLIMKSLPQCDLVNIYGQKLQARYLVSSLSVQPFKELDAADMVLLSYVCK